MKAMILAAGRGDRMRPLTDAVPKPLLRAGGQPLIHHVIERLRLAGLVDLVINVSHLGAAIERDLGDGAALGVHIVYSRESVPLETAGGIVYALPLLDGGPFVVVNGDIYTDYDMGTLTAAASRLSADGVLAHLVLVENPPQHPRGDFSLESGRIASRGGRTLTFSGIGAYHPALFAQVRRGDKARLAELLAAPIASGRVTGEHHRGLWMDIGTPDRLASLDRLLSGAARL